jgi:hypothetical protein
MIALADSHDTRGWDPDQVGRVTAVWTQFWVVEATSAEEARTLAARLLLRWTPRGQPAAAVGAARFFAGPDELALGDQYVEELREIQDLVANTPRETLAARFAHLKQRPLGIPPRAGWVVAGAEGPRSPRPTDWSRPHGPRWVLQVDWPGEPPQLDGRQRPGDNDGHTEGGSTGD